jgi:signal transduction histidine kinase
MQLGVGGIMSIKTKVTLWFSVILIIVVSVTFITVITVSNSILQKTVRDSLMGAVENNVDEIEYYYILSDEEFDKYNEYIPFNGGFLEVDDDFLDRTNGIATGLYDEKGSLIYGENPIGKSLSEIPFSDTVIQTITISKVKYYIFDRKLNDNTFDGLWLRGVVSAKEENSKLSKITEISLIVLLFIVLIGIVIGVLIAGKVLKPIEKITEAAKKINSGTDLKLRINMGEGTDELRVLATQFDKMVDRLDMAFEEERRFTSDASHELRTPVSVISAQCEYALESPMEIDEYIESLEVIQMQSKKMSSLINDMLYISRFENKKDEYNFVETDISELVLNICGDMSLIKEKNINLSHSIEKGIISKVNKELFERLLTNLIGNAYKYGKENGEIKVELNVRNGKNHLSVTDNGIGISENEKEKVFMRFYRSDKSRNSDGTGLGLSLAMEIAKLHGGTITLESQMDKGSCFTFIF